MIKRKEEEAAAKEEEEKEEGEGEEDLYNQVAPISTLSGTRRP